MKDSMGLENREVGHKVDGYNKGMYTIGLFLDMPKAFDSIKHETLLKKMDHYGIRGAPLKWLISYLSNLKKFKSILKMYCQTIIP